MTDAEKREKVIRGLECHAAKGFVACQDCPYYPDELIYEDDDDVEGTICEEKLAADAIALLKEQEARVIELSEISPNIYVWVEDRDDGLFPLKGGVIDPDGDDYFRFDEGLEEDFVYYPTGTFGKYWRIWNLQPTPEQMWKTPWEGDSDAE